MTCFHVNTGACADPKCGSTIHAVRANYRSVAVADPAAAALVVEAAAAAAAVAANSRRVLARARVPSARRAEAEEAETAAQAGSSGLANLSQQAALAKRRAAAQSKARRGKRPYGRSELWNAAAFNFLCLFLGSIGLGSKAWTLGSHNGMKMYSKTA